MIFSAFAVRIANGNRILRAVGFAPMRTRRNFFTTVAERCGTLLKHAENVRAVITNGVGLRVSDAPPGRGTKIGMKSVSR